jgi:hypothetical protein
MIDIIIGVVVLEFGMILSSKSYIIFREMHFSKVVIGSIKCSEKRKNTKSQFKAFLVETLYKVQVR